MRGRGKGAFTKVFKKVWRKFFVLELFVADLDWLWKATAFRFKRAFATWKLSTKNFSMLNYFLSLFSKRWYFKSELCVRVRGSQGIKSYGRGGGVAVSFSKYIHKIFATNFPQINS